MEAPSLPIHVDSTILTAFRGCPRRFWWEYVLRLRPHAINIHFHAGGCFAAGLEAWREAYYLNGQPETEAQAAAVATFIGAWGDIEPPEGSNKTFFRTLAALVSYMDTYPMATDHLQPLRKDSFEYSFAIPTKVIHPSGLPFIFCGRIDLLAAYSGLPAIVDEKTTSALGETFSKKWAMRGQFLGYLWAVRQTLGIKVNMAIVRGTAILKTTINHLEVPQQYPEHLIDEWAVDLEDSLRDMVRCWEEKRFAKVYGDACATFSKCSYTDLCTSKKPDIWFSTFARNTWNPILRNPIAESDTAIAHLTSAEIASAGSAAPATNTSEPAI